MSKRRRPVQSPLLDRVREVRSQQQASMSEGLVKVSRGFKGETPRPKDPVKHNWRDALLRDPVLATMNDPVKWFQELMAQKDFVGVGGLGGGPFMVQTALDPNSVASRIMRQGYSGFPRTVTGVFGHNLKPLVIADDVDSQRAVFDWKDRVSHLTCVAPRMISRPEQEPRVPDHFQVITGWRVWNLHGTPTEGLRLTSISRSSVWTPRVPFAAQCHQHAFSMTSHVAPKLKCECGVWAFKDLETLLVRISEPTIHVLGTVSLWGRVIEHEYGYRAEMAYPSELWLLDPVLKDLGWIYNVPVRVVSEDL